MSDPTKKRRGGGRRVAEGGSDAFWSHVRDTGSCWIWEGYTKKGYGKFSSAAAHRYAYERLRTEIPAGLELDHLCFTPLCVNPWHLEPVTREENYRRYKATRTHCKYGHPLSGDNVYLWQGKHRHCRTCNRERAAAKRASEARS